MKKIVGSILFVSVMLSIVCFFASPYYSAYQAFSAIDNEDHHKLSKYINYPKLRRNLSNQLNTTVENKFGIDKDSLLQNFVSTAGKIAINTGMGHAIDEDNIRLILKTGLLGNNSVEEDFFEDQDNIHLKYDWQGINHFNIIISHEDYNPTGTLHMERDHLFSWKIINISFDL